MSRPLLTPLRASLEYDSSPLQSDRVIGRKLRTVDSRLLESFSILTQFCLGLNGVNGTVFCSKLSLNECTLSNGQTYLKWTLDLWERVGTKSNQCNTCVQTNSRSPLWDSIASYLEDHYARCFCAGCIFCLNGFLQTTKNNFVKTFPFYHLQIFKHFIFQRQKVFCAQLCYLVTFFLEPFSYFPADRGMTLLLLLATSGEILLMSTKPTKVFYFLSCQSQQQQKQMASKNVKMEWTNLSTTSFHSDLVSQPKQINDNEI